MNKMFGLILLILPLSFCAKVREQNSDHAKATKDQVPDSILAGQTIMVAAGKFGRPNPEVSGLILKGRIGGIIFLKANKIELLRSKRLFDSIANSNGIPRLIYATDAEPGMFSNKIPGVRPTPYNNQLKTELECRAAAVSIAEDLISLGINWNFAPV